MLINEWNKFSNFGCQRHFLRWLSSVLIHRVVSLQQPYTPAPVTPINSPPRPGPTPPIPAIPPLSAAGACPTFRGHSGAEFVPSSSSFSQPSPSALTFSSPFHLPVTTPNSGGSGQPTAEPPLRFTFDEMNLPDLYASFKSLFKSMRERGGSQGKPPPPQKKPERIMTH